MDVTLKVIEGAKAGTKIAVKKAEFFIGRGQDCHLCAGSSAISRRHCAIRIQDQRVTIQDLGSRNGTLVNGQRAEGEVELRSGDELSVGPLRLLLTITTGINTQKQPQVKSVAEAAARTAAQQSAGLGDDEISDWLLGPIKGAPSITETQAISMDDTGSLTLNDPHGDAATKDSTAAPADEAANAPKSPTGPKPEAGKLPLTSKVVTKDSREAAAQALRNWNRRK